ncbi:unnamed protein product [Fusarium fujikuroi]|uniref:Uncharacterized protein n=1 Tax=Fusarium fujikuroi TaxID=5127 RepID=A0A9Q9UEF0_FUSFU|nr:uncharacterized protein FFM5_03358 [Fusarium fujikuroi]VTT55586.1 unnamed protein product [Fusarium fujikuroi]VTT73647.1 unnamed protein product [Fusarium fujikuroi]VZH99680.1 unnamed protein product [Fusarium fujikuroi]
MDHLHNSESTDHPRQPWSPAPSTQVNYRVGGFPPRCNAQLGTRSHIACIWDTSLVMLVRRVR